MNHYSRRDERGGRFCFPISFTLVFIHSLWPVTHPADSHNHQNVIAAIIFYVVVDTKWWDILKNNLKNPLVKVSKSE